MLKSPILTTLSPAFASALEGAAKLPPEPELTKGYDGTRDSTLRRQRETNDATARSYLEAGHPPRGYKFTNKER